ncbi:MAG: hypothetical protein IJP79_09260 [Paludibacteraceae bacterium]|nr:hypothetical protein [Paludibacteraceae bacterium]MBQ7747769.1 hypothetical protein [Paludibacteraceae bacterium]
MATSIAALQNEINRRVLDTKDINVLKQVREILNGAVSSVKPQRKAKTFDQATWDAIAEAETEYKRGECVKCETWEDTKAFLDSL